MGKLPILYIDPDQDDQLFMKSVVKDLGVKNPLLCYTHAQQALEYLKTTAEPPLVIICEADLPDMSGFELRDQIATSQLLGSKAIPFVLWVNSLDDWQLEKAQQTTNLSLFLKREEYSCMRQTVGRIIDYWSDCLRPRSDMAVSYLQRQ